MILYQFKAFINRTLTGYENEAIREFLLQEIRPFENQINQEYGLSDAVMQALCCRLLKKFDEPNGLAIALFALAPLNGHIVQEQTVKMGLYKDYCTVAFHFRHQYPIFGDAVFNYFWQLLHKTVLSQDENIATFMHQNLASTDQYFGEQCRAIDKFCVDYAICPPVEWMHHFYRRDSCHFRKLQQMFDIE